MAKSSSSTKAPGEERILFRLLILVAIAIVVIAVLNKVGISNSFKAKKSADVTTQTQQTQQIQQTQQTQQWHSSASQSDGEVLIYESGATVRFENEELLKEGLRQLKDETGIDFVVNVRATEMAASEGRTFYYQKVSDENHVILFVYPNWEKTAYFTFGEDVGKVVSESDIIRLVKLTDYSLDGAVWKEAIEAFLLG